MRMRDSIVVLVITNTEIDAKGRTVNTFEVSRTIKGDLQSVKTPYKFEGSGVTDASDHILFCKDFSLTALDRLSFENVTYRITDIVPYRGHHVEVSVERVT